MNYDPSFLRESIVLLLVAAFVGYAAFRIGVTYGRWRGFEAGKVAGRNDERSYFNARAIQIRIHVFKDGVTEGLRRAAEIYHSPN